MAEIINSGNKRYLHIDGYLYYFHYTRKGVSYWQCRRKGECAARAITCTGEQNSVVVRKGPNKSKHDSHLPNREEVEGLRLMSSIKRRAAEHPEAPPAQIMRALTGASASVLAELPDRENIRKMITRERLREMPSNPQSIQELQEIPDKYRRTMQSHDFLLYDSFQDAEYDEDKGRIIIFATRENLRLLYQSRIWFVDGTFKSAPQIFFQLFAIMGSVTQMRAGVENIVALPFVYALLENKETSTYERVFEVIRTEAAQFVLPQIVMTDFELAIINAVKSHIGDVVRACFFHLCQSVFRKIQSEGLQTLYNSEDRSIKSAAQQMCSLAFVPVEDVATSLDLIDFPEDFESVAQYFEDLYVSGRTARGRRRAVPPRYPPSLWNQYDSVLQKMSRTNNASEGWHHRLNLIIGKNHPSFYSFLAELQKEQSDTECMINQVNIGQPIRKSRAPKHQRMEDRILNIVSSYHTYKERNDIVGYLTNIGYYLHL